MQQNSNCCFNKKVNNEGEPGTTGITALVTVYEGGQSKSEKHCGLTISG